MKCPTCNTEIPEGNTTCPGCGADVSGLTGNVAPDAAQAAEDTAASGAAGNSEDDVAMVSAASDDDAVNSGVTADGGTASTDAAANDPASTDLVDGDIAKAPDGADQQPKKGRMKWAIGGVAVAVVAVAAILVSTMKGGTDPKTAVVDAFKSIYTSEAEKPIEELFGFKQFRENASKQKGEMEMSLAIESSPDPSIQSLAGTGVSVLAKADMEQKKYDMNMALQVTGMDFASMDAYVDNEKVLVALPGLSSKVLYLNYANDLEGQIAASPVLGPVIQESGVDLKVFGDYFDYLGKVTEEKNGDVFGLKDLWKRYKETSKIIDQLKESMTAKKIDAKTLTVDGAEVKCKGYDAVIPKAAAVTFVKDTSKFFLEDEALQEDFLEYLNQVMSLSGSMSVMYLNGESPEQIQQEAWDSAQGAVDEIVKFMEDSMSDIHMTVYTDKKGRMASMDISTTLVETDEDGTPVNPEDPASTLLVNLHADFLGGAYLTQNMKAELVMESDGETISVKVDKTGDYKDKNLTCGLDISLFDGDETNMVSYDGQLDGQSGDYSIYIGLLTDGEEEYALRSEGLVSNLVKGKSFTVSMDTIDFLAYGQSVLTLSGSYGYKPLEGEIMAPEGEQMDMLAATQEDWMSYGMEVLNSVLPLLSQMPGM